MHQLQLIDQDSRLLDDLVNTVISPTLSRSAKLAEIGRILAHFDLPIEAPTISGQLWSATALGKELGVSAQAIGRLANQHNLKIPELGEYRLDQAVHSRKQVQTFYYNKLGRHRLEHFLKARTDHASTRSVQRVNGTPS
ncbi:MULTISPECIES: hypothetical protein [unclassified Aeromonas]|uniref:hypothetical protein n=1 Tax=unclassified Aeromonas TaxID=257493 RepID=UPI00084AE4A5|nr:MULTISPECIES: hypothetical protein [unclassified Aeromonas]OEC50261.1 hypothetical protein A9G04_15950 [Aeromonas sp. ANNP30]OEC62604.1 hypothetical protein A9G49_18310 [Aeromonas sp. ANP5]